MFYKITRLVLVLALLMSMVMCMSLYMGWMGLGYGLMTLKIILITIGIYVFYESRANRNDAPIIRLFKWPVHFLVIPITGLAIWSIGSEEAGSHYWFLINFSLVFFLGLVLVNLVAKNNFKPLFKGGLMALVMAYVTLVLLQMSGYLSNGQLVMYGSAAVVLLGLLTVVFGVSKKNNDRLRS